MYSIVKVSIYKYSSSRGLGYRARTPVQIGVRRCLASARKNKGVRGVIPFYETSTEPGKRRLRRVPPSTHSFSLFPSHSLSLVVLLHTFPSSLSSFLAPLLLHLACFAYASHALYSKVHVFNATQAAQVEQALCPGTPRRLLAAIPAQLLY